MRIVVLGGAGNFGARIVRALQDDPSIELLSAGRRAQPVPGAPGVRSVALDLAGADFTARLAALNPGLVIHCAGPYQGQGYAVAEATLSAGANYIDLADGRAFVAGFPKAMSSRAVAAGRVAICGASTLPALSSAVVDALCAEGSRPASIATVIAPGQHAPRGVATLAAVFSYLGRPFPVWIDGRWSDTWGWMDLRTKQLDFDRRLAAACDVPDLELFPAHYAGVRTATFHAALEFRAQHWVLWSLAALRRAGLPLPVAKWAAALDRLAGVFDRFAGRYGGMSVEVVLDQQGHRARRTWQLTAPSLHGPEIPCIAAILLARQLARGRALPSGAHACVGFLSLEDFEPEFVRWRITHRVIDHREP